MWHVAHGVQSVFFLPHTSALLSSVRAKGTVGIPSTRAGAAMAPSMYTIVAVYTACAVRAATPTIEYTAQVPIAEAPTEG